MKGISPVIATILLLLITVAIVGMAFSFFSRTTSSTTEQVETATNSQVAQFAKQISIEATTSTAVTIRNTGSATIPGSELQFYVNGAIRTCTPVITSIAVQAVATCNFGAPACVTPQKVKATSPANSVEDVCP